MLENMVAIIETDERKPIITSLLDVDFYKFTMGQFVFHRYPNVPVKYGFNNRTKKVKLADVIAEDDLRNELDAVRDLRPTEAEIAFLRRQKNNGAPLFKEDYLEFFQNIQLPDYNLKKVDGQFVTEFPGPWAKAIYWETLDLSIKNELYYRAITKGMDEPAIYTEGNRRLEEKIALFNQHPGLRFMEFGTRRRYSGPWQEHEVKRFKEELGYNQLIGTSNVLLAMNHGLKPVGTQAHELQMVLTALAARGSDDELRAAPNRVLTEWWDEYGFDLSVMLTDTFGTNFFFKDMTEKQARDWKGLRQDSASPVAFAKKQIKFYQDREIDPAKKLFVPSDGLNEKKIVNLYNQFGEQIVTVPALGTNGSNDLGLKPLSLVVKAVEADGNGTVKLSDNPAKSMGSPENIARYQRVFEYNPADYAIEECIY